MRSFRCLPALALALLLLASMLQAQTWTPLTNQPTFAPDTALQLTDGTVIVHQYGKSAWSRLTPDINGSYVNGTFSTIGSLPSNYGPLYFASAVLADGRVIVEGGEYNFGSQVETNLGAIYDPVANTWTAVNPPSGWSEIGDSPAVVLPNGTFIIGRNESTQMAQLDATTLTWTMIGTGKQDDFEEEGWMLLPDGTVLTTDAVKSPNAEKYVSAKNKWISAGSTIVKLEDPGSEEIGPMVLLPNGTVFATGGNASGAGHTATYTPPTNIKDTGTWVVGPDMPGRNDMADAPASILPNGNVLCSMSPGIFGPPVSMYEYDGTQFNLVPNPPSPGMTSYQGRMLVLPTGEVLFLVADGTTKAMAVYSNGGLPDPSWAPTITRVKTTLTRGSANNKVQGTQFNGVSMGANYGDDAQMNTNYPLVRITNTATGHVFYAKTHNHSTMGVQTGTKLVSTQFDVPAGTETGSSTIEVVANGIASAPVTVTIN